mmetsp:Transcript_85374/g.238298  ORF Transcript_85374/g.238298 Transcript_85374/m.238298 type:complete len:81 (+) Transcript_85374:372-614(+)
MLGRFGSFASMQRLAADDAFKTIVTAPVNCLGDLALVGKVAMITAIPAGKGNCQWAQPQNEDKKTEQLLTLPAQLWRKKG